MKRRFLMGMMTVLVLAACLPAHAVVLRYKPKVGSVTKYKVSMAGRIQTSMEGMGDPMQMEMTSTVSYTEKALAKTEKGVKIETTLLSGEASLGIGGQSQDIPMPTGRVVAEMDERGRLLNLIEVEFEDESGLNQMMGAGGENFTNWSQFAAFPEGDVKVGDSWTEKLSLPITPDGPTIDLTLKSKLLGFETVQGQECARIQSTFSGPMKLDMSDLEVPQAEGMDGSMEAAFEGDMIWHYDNEHSVYVHGKGKVGIDMAMTMSMPEGMGGSMTTKMVLNVKTAVEK